jgi:hypothetical protein
MQHERRLHAELVRRFEAIEPARIADVAEAYLAQVSGMFRMRSRNMAEKLISVMPSNSPSSTSLLQMRMRLRSQGSAGTSDGSGKASSRYSQMSVDSITGLPSCTRVGTTPLGLSLR